MAGFISYSDAVNGDIIVKLFNKTVARIVKVDGGFVYRPKDSSVTSEVFETVAAVKRAIESE